MYRHKILSDVHKSNAKVVKFKRLRFRQINCLCFVASFRESSLCC